MSNLTPATQCGPDIANEKGRFRIAVPTWNLGGSFFRSSRKDEHVSREEMTRLFSKELEAPAISTRRARGET